MRLLVIGPAGQVGRAVTEGARARGFEVRGGYASRPPPGTEVPAAPLDKTRPETVRAALRAFEPDWVVDTGALHNVDYCEEHPEEAWRVNRDGTETVAREAEAIGARFLFVSTDFVFDGTGRPPYDEDAPTHALSIYGRSKLEGEARARAVAPGSVVVRSSVIYSWIAPAERQASASQKGVNFGTWAADELAAGRELRIVEDQVASPTLAEDLGGALLDLVELGRPGTFHAAGATAVSRFEFTRRLAIALALDPARVHPVTTSSLHQRAARPPVSSLDSARLRATTGHAMLGLDEALGRFAARWRASRAGPAV